MVRARRQTFSINSIARERPSASGMPIYLPESGGNVAILSRDVPRSYRVFDPRTGEVLREDRLPDTATAQAIPGPGNGPRGLVFTAK
jgi:hypothetical protein